MTSADEPAPWPWRRRPLRLTAMGAGLGALVGAADAAALPSDAGAKLALGCVAALCIAGAAVGLTVALALGAGDLSSRLLARLRLGRTLARSIPDAVATYPLLTPVTEKVFKGGTMRISPYAKAGPWVLLAAGLVAVLVTSVVLRRVRARAARAGPRSRVGLASAFALFGILLLLGERTQHLDAYFYLHLVALEVAALSWLFALDLAVPDGWTERPAATLLPLAVVTGCAVALAAGGWLDDNRARLVLAEAPLTAQRLVTAVRAEGDADHDGYSRWLGGGDCDDADKGVHPLASDVPGNGVDEDCDGHDATESAPTPPPAACTPVGADAIPPAAKGKNLVMVVLDAVRADAVDDGDLAAVHAFAEGSVRFTAAYAPSTSTGFCVPALMSGRVRSTDADVTLVERLRAAGYRTAFALVDDSTRVFPGFLKRFDDALVLETTRAMVSFASGVTDLTGDRATEDVLGWIDRGPREQPFAILVLYHDVHQWYRIDSPEAREADARGVRARYDVVAKALDASVGKLFEGLRARGLEDSTVTVVTADHGEGLGRRGIMTHSFHLYPVLSHVPLSLRVPGLGARRVDTAVGLVDVAPTLAGVLGLDPLPEVDGTDLSALATGTAAEGCTGAYYLREHLQRGVVHDRWMLVHTPEANTLELLDLRDPETATGRPPLVDRSASEPETAQRMRSWLQTFIAHDSAPK